MNKKTLALRQVLMVVVIAVFVLLDQWTKQLAVSHLKGKPGIPFLGDFLVWQYAENTGAAFSLLEGKQWVFTLTGVIVLLAILAFYELSPAGTRMLPLRLTYLFIMAGAIGNMIDRIRYNYVIDFIYVKIINFPIFNVADICVTCACIALIILFVFVYKDNEPMTVLASKKAAKAEEIQRDE